MKNNFDITFYGEVIMNNDIMDFKKFIKIMKKKIKNEYPKYSIKYDNNICYITYDNNKFVFDVYNNSVDNDINAISTESIVLNLYELSVYTEKYRYKYFEDNLSKIDNIDTIIESIKNEINSIEIETYRNELRNDLIYIYLNYVSNKNEILLIKKNNRKELEKNRKNFVYELIEFLNKIESYKNNYFEDNDIFTQLLIKK